MDGGASGRGRGTRGRGRSDPGRWAAPRAGGLNQGREPGRLANKEKTLDALEKAIFSNASSQANVGHGRPQTQSKGLVQVIVRGWKRSKAAFNPDGGLESLVMFLERKAQPPKKQGTAAHSRFKISKVCATSHSSGHRRIRRNAFPGLFTLSRRILQIDD